MKKNTKVYTEQQQLFLDALTPCGGDIRAAMDIAGYAKTTPERYILSILHEEVVEIANKLLAGNSIKAALAMTNVMVDGAQAGAANKLNAAKEILDRSGVTKKSDDVAINVGGGILILPAKKVTTDEI